jgi:hypothetical protein
MDETLHSSTDFQTPGQPQDFSLRLLVGWVLAWSENFFAAFSNPCATLEGGQGVNRRILYSESRCGLPHILIRRGMSQRDTYNPGRIKDNIKLDEFSELYPFLERNH